MRALIINPRSGGGKAARFDLIAQCAKRGVEPIVFEPGDDLAAVGHINLGETYGCYLVWLTRFLVGRGSGVSCCGVG